jgi:hypothetical protein
MEFDFPAFHPDTRVIMANSSFSHISDIKSGDVLLGKGKVRLNVQFHLGGLKRIDMQFLGLDCAMLPASKDPSQNVQKETFCLFLLVMEDPEDIIPVSDLQFKNKHDIRITDPYWECEPFIRDLKRHPDFERGYVRLRDLKTFKNGSHVNRIEFLEQSDFNDT